MGTALPEEGLRELFATLSGMPVTRVLWEGEAKGNAGPTAEGKTGHLVLDLVATRRIGVDEELREYDVDVEGSTRITFSGHRVRTINVRAENYSGESGRDALERIRLRLGSDETGETLNAIDMSLNGEANTLDIDVSRGNRFVPFASLDVLLNHFVTEVVLKGPDTGDTYIDTVVLEGEPDLDAAGTFEVPEPLTLLTTEDGFTIITEDGFALAL